MMLRHLVTHRPPHEWIVVFLDDGPMVEEFRALGVETHVIRSGRLRELLRFRSTVRQIAALIQNRGASGVVSWLSKAHLYGGLAALKAGVPAVWYQLAFPADVHWMDRLATLVPAAGILTCSKAGAELQEGLWPHRACTVVYPGVDLTKFDRKPESEKRALRHTFGLPSNVPIVGIVGRLQRWKGMHVFIDAVARLRDTHPDLHGVIVGGEHEYEPEYPSQLRRQIKHLGLEDHILMAGFQTNPEAWMSTFDVFVHASDREPFGLVVIEAMALGLPVVASNTAGPTEIITEPENGLLAPYGRDDFLAQQIDRYLSDPDFSNRIGRAAYARARSFEASRFAKALASTVRGLFTASSVPA